MRSRRFALALPDTDPAVTLQCGSAAANMALDSWRTLSAAGLYGWPDVVAGVRGPSAAPGVPCQLTSRTAGSAPMMHGRSQCMHAVIAHVCHNAQPHICPPAVGVVCIDRGNRPHNHDAMSVFSTVRMVTDYRVMGSDWDTSRGAQHPLTPSTPANAHVAVQAQYWYWTATREGAMLGANEGELDTREKQEWKA